VGKFSAQLGGELNQDPVSVNLSTASNIKKIAISVQVQIETYSYFKFPLLLAFGLLADFLFQYLCHTLTAMLSQWTEIIA